MSSKSSSKSGKRPANRVKKWRPSPIHKLTPPKKKKLKDSYMVDDQLLYRVTFMGNEPMRYRIENALRLGVDVDPDGSGNDHIERVFDAFIEGREASDVKIELESLIDPVAKALGQMFHIRDSGNINLPL